MDVGDVFPLDLSSKKMQQVVTKNEEGAVLTVSMGPPPPNIWSKREMTRMGSGSGREDEFGRFVWLGSMAEENHPNWSEMITPGPSYQSSTFTSVTSPSPILPGTSTTRGMQMATTYENSMPHGLNPPEQTYAERCQKMLSLSNYTPTPTHNDVKPETIKSESQMRDEFYLERRRKNNESAKRSRETRRLREQLMERQMKDLEQENRQLKLKVGLLEAEILKLNK